MSEAHLLMTDSGGMQEEGPVLGKPVLVLRETTERLETVTAGTARLVGTSEHEIVAAVLRLLRDPAEHARMARVRSPYGDGTAARRCVAAIADFVASRAASGRQDVPDRAWSDRRPGGTP
jgi:UDP-N-acetylglucosamine 2-epimerase (non-hydrolysing)